MKKDIKTSYNRLLDREMIIILNTLIQDEGVLIWDLSEKALRSAQVLEEEFGWIESYDHEDAEGYFIFTDLGKTAYTTLVEVRWSLINEKVH